MDINASTPDIIYQNLLNIFQKGIENAPTVGEQVYEMVNSTSNANVYGWLQHIPGFREWYKNQPRVIRNVETNQYTVANRKFENTIAVPIDDVEDNQLSSYSGIVKQMGATGKTLKDEIVFSMFNNAFATQLAYDGLSWVNAAHKAGLSTINNLMTGALSATTFEAAVTHLRSFTVKPDKISEARPLNPMANNLLLVCSPTLETTAKRILKRRTVDENSAGVDNINFEAADLLVTSYISSTTAWYLLDVGEALKPVFLQERTKLEFRNLTPKDSDQSFMNDEFVYGAKCRIACCPTYPWLMVASTGL